MLLLIVLANIPWFLYGAPKGTALGHPLSGGPLDQAVQTVMIVAVDGRALPLFALLFGYGMVQFARSQERRGTPLPQFQAMLRRRHLALIGIGALHAALLFFGDILGTYGLFGLILVAVFFLRPDRTLRLVRGIMVGLVVAFALAVLGMGLLAAAFPETMGETWSSPWPATPTRSAPTWPRSGRG